MENYSELISIVSLLLAVLAIALAIWQTTLSLKQTKKAVEQTKELLKHEENFIAIKQALSTRYLGEFPIYADDIASLIDKAKLKVVIFCDMPGIAQFSNPSAWFKIKQAIERKINQGIDFSISLYSNEMRLKLIREQYQMKEKDFSAWVNSTAVKNKMKQFLKRYAEHVSIENLTLDEWIGISDTIHSKILNETYVGLEVQEITELIPLRFWMIDDNEVIMDFPSFTNEVLGYGFYSSDKSLINALFDIKSRYLKYTTDA